MAENTMPTLEAPSSPVEHEEMPKLEINNAADIEHAWAMRAYRQMEVHYRLLCTIDPRELKLTGLDDLIYGRFRKCFPNFPLKKFEESDLKGEIEKMKWRLFITEFDSKVEDGRFGCLIRMDADGAYSQENTILGVKTQFLAIEIARNREGFNDNLYKRSEDFNKTA